MHPIPCAPRRRGSASSERGVVLVWALISAFTIGALILTASSEMKALNDISDAEFSGEGQAQAVAEAGLSDAYAWFRRQQTQPVTVFAPKRDLAANPPVNETDDPTVGLVREYELTPGLWARYEVRPGTPAESYSDLNKNGIYDKTEPFVDTDGNGRWSPAEGTRDVTAERGVPGSGAVWRIVSRGSVYRRPDVAKPLGQGRNAQIATSLRAVEIRRLALALPASAAICCSNGKDVKLGDRTRVRSDVLGVAYPSLTGTPTLTGLADVLAPTQFSAVTGWADSVDAVFGLGWQDLRMMADISATVASDVPSPIPEGGLVVVTGKISFDASHPLRGQGIVAVKGNVDIKDGSNSAFTGLLYIEGDLSVRGACSLEGQVVVRGKVDLKGSGADYAEVIHDPTIVSRQLLGIGQYRYTKSTYEPLPVLADGRPDEHMSTASRGAPTRIP